MLKGKKKGFQKVEARISDKTIAPYYITAEENQYTIMLEGSTIPQGYYSSLESALKKIAHYKNLEELNQTTVTLNEYLNHYRQTVNIISQAIK